MWEQLTFWSEERHVRTCPSRAKERVSKEHVQASRLTLCDWLMKRAVNTSSGKTFPAYSVATGAEISLPFYPCSADTPSTFRKTDGSQVESSRTADPTATDSRGECWTRNLPEFPAFRSPYRNADGVCSLSDVLETGNVPPQYYLSPTACRGILHRASKRGKSLPEVLEIALRRQSECAQDATGGGKGALVGDNLSHTLQTGNDQTVVEFAQDCANTVEVSCYKGPGGTWNERTIVSQFWNGEQVAESLTTTSNNQRIPDKGRMQMVVGGFIGRQGSGAGSVGYEENVAPTQRSGLITDVVCFHGSQDTITNETHANSIGRNGGLENCVCYDARGNGYGETVNTITGDHNNRVTDYTPLVQNTVASTEKFWNGEDVANTITQRVDQNRMPDKDQFHGIVNQHTVRRLTPLEAERLMGFPDNHTRISWNGKPEDECPDAPRYKACGNSMCVNCMEWIGRRIEEFAK